MALFNDIKVYAGKWSVVKESPLAAEDVALIESGFIMLGIRTFSYVSYIKAGQSRSIIDITFVYIIYREKGAHGSGTSSNAFYVEMRFVSVIGEQCSKIGRTCIQKSVMNSVVQHFTALYIV